MSGGCIKCCAFRSREYHSQMEANHFLMLFVGKDEQLCA